MSKLAASKRAATGGVLLLLISLLASTFGVANAQTLEVCKESSSGPITKVVALDPGHGAGDPGAVYKFESGGELLEKNLTLAIANRTREILVANNGYRVCLTRTDDSSNPTNTQRAQFANSVKAQVFVLIHLNGSSNDLTNYTKTFWGKKSKDESFSNHMYGNLYPALATYTQLASDDKLTGGGVGQFATGALLKSTMPGTLTESVFLTNRYEAVRFRDGQGSREQQIAEALANGITTWLNK